jgi:hypothetical protein
VFERLDSGGRRRQCQLGLADASGTYQGDQAMGGVWK